MALAMTHEQVSPVELATALYRAAREFMGNHPGCTPRVAVQASRILETYYRAGGEGSHAARERSYHTERYEGHENPADGEDGEG